MISVISKIFQFSQLLRKAFRDCSKQTNIYVFRYAQLFPQHFAVFMFLPRGVREQPNLLTGHIVYHISFSSLDIEFQTNIKCYFNFPRRLRYTGIYHWLLWIKPCRSYSTSDHCSHLVVSIFINILS